ncbi:conjugal transfer protein TraD (plasmid) [Afipia carboxidovorans OM5]|uniref:Conjugal transfer protein TraD n=1 Tax=Afipia carboxidovorans (strain ATCC 49405 / DSM 1227 / KCTC 32145 / OM5) TaxID=504832 RepID=F8C168_AFIC5|nr:type IV conjugative transfer system coupling protein TraD [Afipia carboxidovorans]AEI04549.1 conjugal transfer protein TraD [Afipia carboxidovorans OM4]AEI08178.1 conjugal transfer protein TraD [Afipia carboxidovorans OM5]
MERTRRSDDRKKDTREKIQLGGLIVKAGLRYEKRAVLLGMLIDAGGRIRASENERERLAAIGAEAFGDERE